VRRVSEGATVCDLWDVGSQRSTEAAWGWSPGRFVGSRHCGQEVSWDIYAYENALSAKKPNQAISGQARAE
jgi:hypothetical protein